MEVRKFRPGDENELSVLVRRTLVEVNEPDCPKEEIDFLYALYTPEHMLEIAEKGNCYVIEEDGILIGTGTILPDKEWESEIVGAFLLPEYIGKGYGRVLFDTLESDELFTSADRVWLTSSNTALDFYEHYGYEYVYGYRGVDDEGLIVMEKRNNK